MTLVDIFEDGLFAPRKIASALRTTGEEVARTVGPGKNAVQRRDRIGSDRTQRRLREMVEIVDKVEPRFGSPLMACARYRSEPLRAARGLLGRKRDAAGAGRSGRRRDGACRCRRRRLTSAAQDGLTRPALPRAQPAIRRQPAVGARRGRAGRVRSDSRDACGPVLARRHASGWRQPDPEFRGTAHRGPPRRTPGPERRERHRGGLAEPRSLVLDRGLAAGRRQRGPPRPMTAAASRPSVRNVDASNGEALFENPDRVCRYELSRPTGACGRSISQPRHRAVSRQREGAGVGEGRRIAWNECRSHASSRLPSRREMRCRSGEPSRTGRAKRPTARLCPRLRDPHAQG